MTTAPENLKAPRRLLIEHLDIHEGSTAYSADLDPGEVGIVGDEDHFGGYHCGRDRVDPDEDYSVVESPRDRAGLTLDSAALDVGWFEIRIGGVVHNLRTFSLWCVAQCEANAPDTRDIREIIYSPDGRVVKRWDRLHKRSSGDSSHRSHTHFSFFRDAIKAGRDVVEALFRRYLRHIGLLPEEGFMAAISDADQRALIWRVEAIASGRPAVAGGPTKGEPVALNVRLATQEQRMTALTTAIGALDDEVAARLRVEFERIEADEAATLAAVEQAAAEDAVRDAELRALIEAGLSGERDADEVLRIIADKIRPTEMPGGGPQPGTTSQG